MPIISVMLRKLACFPRQNPVARAIFFNGLGELLA
jgi:hypothetical protein